MKPIDEMGCLRIATMGRTTELVKRDAWNMKLPRARVKRAIAKVCWWTLHKIGVMEPFIEPVSVMEYRKEHAEQVTSQLLPQLARLRRDFVAAPDRYCLVMGGETFKAILREYTPDSAVLEVPAARFMVKDERGYSAEFHGFPVHVVPWLKGAAVLPKAIVTITKEVSSNPPYGKV